MSPTIGHISVPITNPRQFEMRPYSDYLTKLIDQVSPLSFTDKQAVIYQVLFTVTCTHIGNKETSR